MEHIDVCTADSSKSDNGDSGYAAISRAGPWLSNRGGMARMSAGQAEADCARAIWRRATVQLEQDDDLGDSVSQPRGRYHVLSGLRPKKLWRIFVILES